MEPEIQVNLPEEQGVSRMDPCGHHSFSQPSSQLGVSSAMSLESCPQRNPETGEEGEQPSQPSSSACSLSQVSSRKVGTVLLLDSYRIICK